MQQLVCAMDGGGRGGLIIKSVEEPIRDQLRINQYLIMMTTGSRRRRRCAAAGLCYGGWRKGRVNNHIF